MNEQVQTEQSINNRHRETVSLLEEKRLMEAIKKLNTQRLPDEGGEVYTRLESYQTSYGYMLQYLRQGMDDPQREAIYNDLLRKVWKLADDIRLHQLDGVSRHAYHLQNRSGGTSPLLLDLAYYRERLESFPDGWPSRDSTSTPPLPSPPLWSATIPIAQPCSSWYGKAGTGQSPTWKKPGTTSPPR